MAETSTFKLPDYARYASEVVHSVYLEVWWEETTRWLRIDVLKDLVGNYGPFSIRIFSASGDTGEFLGGEYPYWQGDSPEEAVQKCLEGLSNLAGISRGIETKNAR